MLHDRSLHIATSAHHTKLWRGKKCDNTPEEQSGPSKEKTKSINISNALTEDAAKKNGQAQHSKDIAKEQSINYTELHVQNEQLTSAESDLVNNPRTEDFMELLDDLKKHLNTEYKRFYE